MRIQNGTYYVKYKEKEESASLTFYKEVGANSFSIDSWLFDIDSISFEDAYWRFRDFDNFDPGIQVTKSVYDKWVLIVEETKSKMLEFGTKHARYIDKPITKGDFLFDGKTFYHIIDLMESMQIGFLLEYLVYNSLMTLIGSTIQKMSRIVRCLSQKKYIDRLNRLQQKHLQKL